MTQAPQPSVRPAYYTTAEIAIIMCCCTVTARQYARMFHVQGQAIKKGREYLVPRDIFDDWRRRQDGTDAYYKVGFKVIKGGK